MPASPPAPATVDAPRRCAHCGTAAAGGRFCAECGAPFDGALCAACRSALTAGAQFCHRCGTAVGAVPSGGQRATSVLPWIVVSAALLVLLVAVVGRNLGLGLGGARPVATEAETPLAADPGAAGDAPLGGADAAAGGSVRAPDISALSPGERADRLFDRVMRLSEQGKRDSVEFFAPMVMSAYQMLGPLDLDQHYDVGRLGVVLGAGELARAEADTILRADRRHLLGLALAAEAAASAQDSAAARGYYRRLVAAAPTELKAARPEYARHRRDIDAALAAARKLGVSG